MGRAIGLIAIVFVVALVLGMRNGHQRNDAHMRSEMIRGCVDNAAGKGLPADTNRAFCECTIDGLVQQHGYGKIDQNMTGDAATQPAWLMQDMRSHAKQCAADMNLAITFQP
jgi:hypothetical protein